MRSATAWLSLAASFIMLVSGTILVAAERAEAALPRPPEPAPDATPIAAVDVFPEPGTAHFLAGELTMVDHVNRMAVLRPDRTDAQNKYHQDLPHHVNLLPYAEVFSHGARANLEDLRLGTHLCGWFYLGPRGWFTVRLASTDYEATVKNEPNERSPDSPYCRAIRLEDDFSFDARCDRVWEIVSIDHVKRTITARPRVATAGERLETPARQSAAAFRATSIVEGTQNFDFDTATRVWKARGLVTTAELVPGLRVLINRTWATLHGPGRLTEVWIDVESRRQAIETQTRTFVEHERLRGVPATIDSIEYSEQAAGVVTARLYAASSAAARDAIVPKTRGTLIVAEPTLRSYDQTNDGIAVWFQDIVVDPSPPPGSSGILVKFHVWEMLEGIRPGRTVRIQAADWPRTTLPREEQLHQFDLRPPLIDEDGQQRSTAPFSR